LGDTISGELSNGVSGSHNHRKAAARALDIPFNRTYPNTITGQVRKVTGTHKAEFLRKRRVNTVHLDL
jgi:hypothetical protein